MAEQFLADDDRVNRSRFQTTRWSVVLRIKDSNVREAEDVWNEIARIYWFPLYAFCRRKGTNDHDAQDMTQAFFVHLLNGNRFESISPEKGRFRSYLLRTFENFMANHHRNANRLIRGGGKTIISLEQMDADARFAQAQACDHSLDQAFDREWAVALLDRVKQRLSEHYERRNQSELFAAIRPHLIPRANESSYAELGRQLQLSPAAVGMAITRMRSRYRNILLEEVSATIEKPEDLEDELRTLMSLFSDKK
ncbi:RNA polymerase sigma factor [Schlesneria paludicola]|uniref:RNA polymerase sigma factor n=1 Tax=Schlesneria paludicola TaxID=360056 RepID=UPI00029A59C3|nr:sigma-70 family RNA polymerase sigma factor [Schlesneria paludicola]